MKKKKGNLSELMQFAGKHKYLTYSSWVLSVISAALALVPLVYIFFIIKEVIEDGRQWPPIIRIFIFYYTNLSCWDYDPKHHTL